jgi:histidinol phosphatase-like enzyme (inositol monophosphatase family)
MQYEKELQFAKSVAMHAGELALGYQSQELIPESKPDLSPVTIADKECEKLIASRIRETFPQDGILGEEGTAYEGNNGRRWIIDPIDGTRDFVRRLPLWSVLIGFEMNAEVVVGVSCMPARNEMYWAAKESGAYLNDKRLHVSGISDPSQALACVNGFNNVLEFGFSATLLEWLSHFWAVRSMGGCMDAVLLASGRAEVWLEPYAQPWDLAPLKVILEEAGARFFNFDGGNSIYGGNCAACVPGLEKTVRKLLGLVAHA